jgi:hypothetical protein
MEKTSADFSNDIAEKDKEIATAIRCKEEVHQAQLELRRQKLDLDVALSKANYNIEKLKIERSLLMHDMFAARNSGL